MWMTESPNVLKIPALAESPSVYKKNKKGAQIELRHVKCVSGAL